MRRRLVVSSLVTTLVAIVLFAAPLAVVIHLVLLRDSDAGLERAALRLAGSLDPADVAGSARAAGADDGSGRRAGVRLAVYGPDGRRLAGEGPATTPVLAVDDTWPRQSDAAGSRVVEIPVEERGVVVAMVRAAEPTTAVRTRTVQSVLGLAALGLLVLGLAALVARRLSARVSAPIQDLTTATRALAEGVFAVDIRRSGIPELDEAAAALTATGERLGGLLEREAGFADDATHQLRTPLTGLRLAVEAALAGPDHALRAGLGTVSEATDRLVVVVDDLVSLRRPAGSGAADPQARPLAPETLGRMAQSRWAAAYARAGRPLDVLVTARSAGTAAAEAAVRQALDALLDNALTHGRGAVTVTVRDAHGAVAVDVADEGDTVRLPSAELFRRGVATAGGSGIGLALARSLVAAEGGRLELTSREPTRFTLLLPGAGRPGARRAEGEPA
ncbi:HAMP domain-containing sensor histidine kinase [Kineosporia sp. R_H_3]|uniref:sensor histidine kinase n=1 Tax=Kineosporia sp. R_H_3 TaxID=1961848 RepID=UPI000B4A8B6D|nr:HAMP domain-containing sensor histidine kinase [Kineosporia sp. R_H_3]